MAVERTGEYAEQGDYHRQLDPNWRYYPVYVTKMDFVRGWLDDRAPSEAGFDLGCGEGLLVEEYSGKGYALKGVDYNYSSEFVRHGDITNLDLEDGCASYVMSLDVLEHLDFPNQEKALAEMARILKPGGRALISMPNLAHFASRVSFLLLGKLIRTATIERHPGDRPIGEFLALAKSAGLRLIMRKGLFPTFPVISAVTAIAPAKALPLHRIANRLAPPPGWCFLNILEFERV